MPKSYIHASEEAGHDFLSQEHTAPFVMLNLLRFNRTADYSHDPKLGPSSAISGLDAYRKYMKCVYPLLSKIGGSMIFSGTADKFLIGPPNERWDAILLIKYPGLREFKAFATDQAYVTIAGHRTAALADSRLLPIAEGSLL